MMRETGSLMMEKGWKTKGQVKWSFVSVLQCQKINESSTTNGKHVRLSSNDSHLLFYRQNSVCNCSLFGNDSE